MPGEPRGFDDLVRLRADLAAGVLRREANHQRVGERPRLAAKVANVAQLEGDFLANLARDGLFERFAWLDEAGQHAEEAVSKGSIARQQELVAPLNEHDHRGAESGKAEPAAARA